MSASRSSEAPGAAHLIGEWARLLLCTLRDAGVRELWVSPGSRSTPFTWVAQQTAGLTLRPVIDERSAAFLALGHTRISGQPCALLCTSGSAAANYFPAVVEASLAHLPLMVLTADRPLDVQHAGAAQAIDQTKLYGDHARAFFDLGPPDAAPSALCGLQRSVAQAVAAARGPLPGPVHLNLRARKPLEPAPPVTGAEHALTAQVTSLIARPLARHAPTTLLANEAVLAAARTLSQATSGVIVVGPLPAVGPSLQEPLAELSRLLGFPIFAEASSQVRFALPELGYPLFDWLLSTPEVAARLRPDVLLCIGATPTSSAFERWAAGIPRRIVLAAHGHPDPLGSAELVASGQLATALPALIEALRLTTCSSGSNTAPAGTPLPAPRFTTRTYPTTPPPNPISLASAASADASLDTRTYPTTPPPNPISLASAASADASLDTRTYPTTPPLDPISPASASCADALLDTRTYSNRGREEGLPEVRDATAASSPSVGPSSWASTVSTMHARVERVVERALEEAGPNSEGAVVRSVVEALPDGAVLVLGNSLPIRDVEAYVTRAARLRVVSQRGANGIDGLVSGAIGSAIASEAPTLLLLGDVSLLHDLGGLAAAALVASPLVIAVIDNAGGRIFDQLPARQLYAETPAARLWLTPPNADLAHAAALFGLSYSAPTTLAAIRTETSAALAKPGVKLLHLRVAPDSAAKLRQRIIAELSAELAAERD